METKHTVCHVQVLSHFVSILVFQCYMHPFLTICTIDVASFTQTRITTWKIRHTRATATLLFWVQYSIVILWNIIVIFLGEHDQTDTSGTETDHRIVGYHAHDRYFAEQQYAYDIALVKISPPANLNIHVQTIALPFLYEQVSVGTKCVLTGKFNFRQFYMILFSNRDATRILLGAWNR